MQWAGDPNPPKQNKLNPYVNIVNGFRSVNVCSFILSARSAQSPIPAKRIGNIIDYLTYAIFCYTARGLYEEHKFIFTLLLGLKIELQSGGISSTEFDVLIKGESWR